MSQVNVGQLVEMRNVLAQEQRRLYVEAVTSLNMRYREILTKEDFGCALARNCARDIAGEIVRRYFDTSDYYITVDQMYDRIVHFSYEDSTDLFASDETIRKMLYNMSDDPRFSESLTTISAQNQAAQKKLFEKEKIEYTGRDGSAKTKRVYIDEKLMDKSKDAYRKDKIRKGEFVDEVTGKKTERLEVDHAQAAATATYNTRYMSDPEVVQALKEFYNSPENFQLLGKRANGSKGDVRVFEVDGKVLSSGEAKELRAQIKKDLTEAYMAAGDSAEVAKQKAAVQADDQMTQKYDVTFRATAKETTDAVCERWENAKQETKETLMAEGKLGPDGKVPPDVRQELENNLRSSMNAYSKKILSPKIMKKVAPEIAKDALAHTVKNGLGKILIGQTVYYALPPVVFETKCILRKRGTTIQQFVKNLRKAGGRIISYVTSKLGEIFQNVAYNGLHKFIKTFFDILISLLKETVKKLVNIAKQLVLSLVQCVRVIADPKSSPAQKADAVTKTLSATVTTIILEILFEWMEKQFGLPDIIMEPLQLIVTILATNLVMLILERADLFDVRYGLLVSNIDAAFAEEQQQLREQGELLLQQSEAEMNLYMDELKESVREMENSLVEMDLFQQDAMPELEKLNEMFDMGIDFRQEWQDFCESKNRDEVRA